MYILLLVNPDVRSLHGYSRKAESKTYREIGVVNTAGRAKGVLVVFQPTGLISSHHRFWKCYCKRNGGERFNPAFFVKIKMKINLGSVVIFPVPPNFDLMTAMS